MMQSGIEPIPAAPGTNGAPATWPGWQGSSPTSSQEEAWAAFVAKRPPNMKDENFFAEWWRIIGEAFGDGVDPASLTPAQWAWMRDFGPGQCLPF